MKNALVTVIVPIYNVEEYLPRCVDSIIEQTYRNLEIILVDDGSTDTCVKICDEYEKKDERIIVVHKKNGGLSDARNVALDIAKGDYITLVDSDDYLKEDYVEYLYSLLTENQADIATCELKKVYDGEELEECQEDIEVIDGVSALECMLYQRKVAPCAVCKLYKRELLDTIRYPKGIYYEDLATIYRILLQGCKVVIGKKQKYYYYQRRNSIMNQTFNEKKLHRLYVTEELKEYVEERCPQLIEAASARCFLAGIQVYREIPYKQINKKYIDEAWDQIRRYRMSVIMNSKAKMSMRIMAWSSFLGKRVLAYLGKMYSIVFGN
ncbi:MAG: glycosyltransferase [Roseburia sp.]|nr:glycosyltransferase [Roseburia sp.]